MLIQPEPEILIRSEALADQIVIDKLLKSQFDHDRQANLVRSLRKNGNNTLSLVACNEEGHILGHLAFSPVFIDGKDEGVQIVSSFYVAPQYNELNIENRLMKEGIEILYELGYSACIAFSDSAIYQDFGFIQTKQFDLEKLAKNVMIKELICECTKNIGTKLSFCEELRRYFENSIDV